MKRFITLATITSFLFAQAVSVYAVAPFPDVPENHIYANEIQYVKINGYAGGFSDGNFKPENSITRAELTKMVINAKYDANTISNCKTTYIYGYNQVTGEEIRVFPDIANDYKFVDYICMAKNHNVVRGYADGEFKANNLITFGEAAKVIVRALDKYHNISESATLPEYLNLDGLSITPPTLMKSDIDKAINRGEIAYIINIVGEYNYNMSMIGENSLESLAGSWHANPIVGSGYSERFMFKDDGSVVFYVSEYDSSSNVLSKLGTYTYEKDDIRIHFNKVINLDGTTNSISEDVLYGLISVEEVDPNESPYPIKITLKMANGDTIDYWKYSDEMMWDNYGEVIL